MNTTGKEGYWPIVQGLRPGLNDGEEPQYIQLRSVKSLKPVPTSETSSSPDNKEWKRPKVYKGTSEGRSDSEETVSCERCESSYPASEPGETGFVPTVHGIVRLCVDCAKKWY